VLPLLCLFFLGLTPSDSNTKIASLIDAARKGAVGDLMIDKAIEGINKRITMLNTAAIFAEAGQLEPNNKGMHCCMR
jgi:hypothetical protein